MFNKKPIGVGLRVIVIGFPLLPMNYLSKYYLLTKLGIDDILWSTS